ncbi:hypothetical protein NE237_023548 [Protea cynaroides]|uniref:Uncharacterized protein n=1 Tax=Protea cynaroides TaxID=273540 RepID=A0A9Q0HHA7_9MAGN|nr:hypothetical protein NE237_023548 [Protea cynaroides]
MTIGAAATYYCDRPVLVTGLRAGLVVGLRAGLAVDLRACLAVGLRLVCGRGLPAGCRQWWKVVQEDKDVGVSALFLASFIFWQHWIAPNDAQFQKHSWTLIHVIEHAAVAFREFKLANEDQFKKKVGYEKKVDSIGNQESTDPVCFYICSDASLIPGSNTEGPGFCFKDNGGILRKEVSCSGSFSEIIIGEALAMRMALMEVRSEGLDRVMVQLDCERTPMLLMLALPGAAAVVRPWNSSSGAEIHDVKKETRLLSEPSSSLIVRARRSHIHGHDGVHSIGGRIEDFFMMDKGIIVF